MTRMNDFIYRLTIPFSDVYTTVYVIRTPQGSVLFDTATYDSDVVDYILPALEEVGVSSKELKYVFISHDHGDHSGGLKKLLEEFPEICIVSCCSKLREEYSEYEFLLAQDGDKLLETLQVTAIPGHTPDAAGIFDTRTRTLISGDCLQLYGLFGSGDWGANISLVEEHMDAVDKLRRMGLECILTAHDYHPYGYIYLGKAQIAAALDACIEPLLRIKGLILDNPEAGDEQICQLYHEKDKLPTLNLNAVAGVRRTLLK